MPILSLIVTISLLTLIVRDIQKFSDGTATNATRWAVLIEAILLFVLPCAFNPQVVAKRFNKFTMNLQAKKQKELELKIEKQIRFNVEYQPNLVVKCPKCGFDNPMKAKTCYNCGYKLNF